MTRKSQFWSLPTRKKWSKDTAISCTTLYRTNNHQKRKFWVHRKKIIAHECVFFLIRNQRRCSCVYRYVFVLTQTFALSVVEQLLVSVSCYTRKMFHSTSCVCVCCVFYFVPRMGVVGQFFLNPINHGPVSCHPAAYPRPLGIYLTWPRPRQPSVGAVFDTPIQWSRRVLCVCSLFPPHPTQRFCFVVNCELRDVTPSSQASRWRHPQETEKFRFWKIATTLRVETLFQLLNGRFLFSCFCSVVWITKKAAAMAKNGVETDRLCRGPIQQNVSILIYKPLSSEPDMTTISRWRTAAYWRKRNT